MTHHQQKVAEPKLIQEPPPARCWNALSGLWQRKTTIIAALSIVGILLHLLLRFGFPPKVIHDL